MDKNVLVAECRDLAQKLQGLLEGPTNNIPFDAHVLLTNVRMLLVKVAAGLKGQVGAEAEAPHPLRILGLDDTQQSKVDEMLRAGWQIVKYEAEMDFQSVKIRSLVMVPPTAPYFCGVCGGFIAERPPVREHPCGPGEPVRGAVLNSLGRPTE